MPKNSKQQTTNWSVDTAVQLISIIATEILNCAFSTEAILQFDVYTFVSSLWYSFKKTQHQRSYSRFSGR